VSDTAEQGFGTLAVRLITQSEIARFNELLDQHHYLGHHLVGRVLRYVACEDDEWVALLGFGSPALSLRPREDFIGWSEQAKLRRLRFVLNNQRFCVLDDRRRRNLASAVLSRTLRRVSADAEAAYGDPVLLVETFTDPALHCGTCYRAANFVLVGQTSGYGRKNGSWVRHDVVKCAWLYPLEKRAPAILAAPFDHPRLQSALQRRRNVVDLNTVVIDGEGGLYTRLAALADHRKPKGVRHELSAVLLVCAAAILCGSRGPAEIAEWAQDLDDEARARLHCRQQPMTGRLVVPSESTIQRTLRHVDKEAFDRIVNETVREVVTRRAAKTRPSTQGMPGDEVEAGTPGDDDTDEAAPRCLAVDGKSLRGAVRDDGRLLHLLSVLTQKERVVIGQEEVDHKTNEINHFAPLLAPLDIKGNLVTADSLHTQRKHAHFLIGEKKADYLFYADLNQPKLYEAIAGLDEDDWSEPYTETDKGHGRIETRTIWTSSRIGEDIRFPHVAQLVRILREVDDARTRTALHTETVYGVTSTNAGRRVLLAASRGQWQIENGLHWVRDATMGEDASKVRSGSAPRVLATLRNLAIGVLRLAGVENIAKGLRHLSRRPAIALTLLGL
jgi:predicted transposase YbfD/YdcC/GNAT superfamily N-acetyltransferase